MTTPRHPDPASRRASFHTSGQGSSFQSAQLRRRNQALQAQHQRRTHAFEAARALPADLNLMGDLNLSPSDEEQDHEDDQDHDGTAQDASMHDSPASHPFADATMSPTAAEPNISNQKRSSYKQSNKKKKNKVKYQPWARDLLTQGELLDLAQSLPHGLESDWRATVVPRGKRCLCATGTASHGTNTVLYSRVSGRTLERRTTVLPPDCLLDAVYDAELSVLWVLDLIKYGTFFVECEADMRAFFLASKLSELPLQPYLAPAASPATLPASLPLLVLPAPTYAAPLVPSVLLPLLASVTVPSSLSFRVLSGQVSPPGPATLAIPLAPTGLMLHLSAAHYESGLTALAGWVPVQTEPGKERIEGVQRMAELVKEWEARGGEAATSMEGVGDAQVVEEMDFAG